MVGVGALKAGYRAKNPRRLSREASTTGIEG